MKEGEILYTVLQTTIFPSGSYAINAEGTYLEKEEAMYCLNYIRDYLLEAGYIENNTGITTEKEFAGYVDGRIVNYRIVISYYHEYFA